MVRRKRTVVVEVEPIVLDWAIKSSGRTTNDILLKLKISEATFKGWLNGDRKPTLRQLENLANLLKRPLSAFLLSEPPKEKPLPKDYRMISDRIGRFENKTILAIRKARRLQGISKELSENLKSDIESDVASVSLSNDPILIANKYLKFFNIDLDTRKKWKTSYDAFTYFRNLIEDRNIVVLKMPMLTEDARGFALVEDTPAVIVVNSKDLPEAQVFTLLHEFGHILLNKSGVSMPDNALFQKEVDRVEKWCNEFASAILLPVDIAKQTFEKNKQSLIETKTLTYLSRKFKISKAMLLYNMSKLKYISNSQYNYVLKRFNPTKPLKKKEKKKKSGGGVSADIKCLSEKGQKFVSLVTQNLDGGHITRSDALDYLSLKSTNLEKVTNKATK